MTRYGVGTNLILTLIKKSNRRNYMPYTSFTILKKLTPLKQAGGTVKFYRTRQQQLAAAQLCGTKCLNPALK